jgi:DNA-binding Lrp family transcriptional regulator
VDAYVLIQTQAVGEPVAEKLRAVQGVIAADDLTGAYDAIMLVRSGSTRDLMENVVAEIRKVPSVSRALPAPLIHSPTEDSATESLDRGVSSRDRAA